MTSESIAKAFAEQLVQRKPELAEHADAIERLARGFASLLARVDTEEYKKAYLCQILLFRARKGQYGDLSKEPLKTIVDDLEMCFTQEVLDAYTEEELSALLEAS